MKRKTILLLILIVLMMLLLSGCIPGNGRYSSVRPAGFFSGVWHGWIAPLSLILGLMNRDIRIYEVMNTGWAYDFGFYISIISGFGGLSLARGRHRKQ